MYALKHLVLVDDLDAMLVGLLRGILAHAGEVRVHDGRGGRMSKVAGAVLPVDLQRIGSHVCPSAAGRVLHVCGKNSWFVRGERWSLMSPATHR
jgi:hypothetical protein